MSIEIFKYCEIKPLAPFGFTNKFWTLHIDTIAVTWVAMLMIIGFIAAGRFFLKRRQGGTIAFGYEKIVVTFIDFYKDSFHSFNYNFFLFITSLFFFTFFCCLVGILPFLHKEPTGDLNTAIAISVTSFIYILYQKISAHGIKGYLREFIEPIFALAPIHLVGELSKIVSMASRLFGNILGGSIITMLIMQLVHNFQIPLTFYLVTVIVLTSFISFTPLYREKSLLKSLSDKLRFTAFLLAYFQIILGIGEGLIQSFVIIMLTSTYLSMSLQHDEPETDHATSHPSEEEHL